jgi:type VI secretion system protein ImpA
MNTPKSLLAPTLTNPPCGDDLIYDADFQALENAAQGKPEQQFGETVIAAEPPDWRDVESKALELLTRTKDLRITALLTRAWTSLRDMEGAADGLELIADLIDAFWSSLHPLPEEGDYFMRMNALAFLEDASGFLLQLRQTPLSRGALGVVFLRDAELVAKGLSLSGSSPLSADQIRIGVAQAKKQGDNDLQAFSRLGAAIARIDKACADQLAEDQRPSLNNIKALLRAVAEVVPAALDNAVESAFSESGLETKGSTLHAELAASPVGALRNRDDAVAQLLRVAEFLEATEPTNPAPLLIRRAMRLMQMGFIDIVRELSPESIAQIENITGSRAES